MSTANIVINTTKEAAEAIRREVERHPESQSRLSERRNLNGDVATWIVMATLSVQALPTVLGFIKERLATDRVTKIKYDKWEVENPTPEMIEEFVKLVRDDHKGEKTTAADPGDV